MASYHIWHPAFMNSEASNPEVLTLEAFITRGDSIFLSRGTEAFAQAALKVLGLPIQLVSWELKAMRTHYFNSYRESSTEWEDAWDLAWRLRVTLPSASVTALLEPPGWGYFDLDAADSSFRPDDMPAQWPGWHCLLLADALDASTLDQVERLVRESHPDAVCARAKAYGQYPQLRCDLGYLPRAFYEQGALDAEALVSKISQAGAYVRFTGLHSAKSGML